MNREGVLVIGSSNMDLVVTCERFPKPGETILGKKLEMFPGGKGANQAVACAKQGCRTFFISKMGKDNFSQKLIENFEECGVSSDNILFDNSCGTGTALITVDGSGQNKIIVISGSNMQLSPKEIMQKSNLFSTVKIVLTQLEIPLETVIESAKITKENNAVFILNPAPARDLPESLLNLVDYLTPNENELQLLSGLKIDSLFDAEAAAKKLLEKGVKNIIVTMGEKGALAVSSEACRKYPVRKVKVVDSTAAGDAFNGALASALSNDKPLDEAIEYANKVASFSVTKMGAQSSMPNLADMKDLHQVINK